MFWGLVFAALAVLNFRQAGLYRSIGNEPARLARAQLGWVAVAMVAYEVATVL